MLLVLFRGISLKLSQIKSVMLVSLDFTKFNDLPTPYLEFSWCALGRKMPKMRYL